MDGSNEGMVSTLAMMEMINRRNQMHTVSSDEERVDAALLIVNNGIGEEEMERKVF